MHRILFWLLLLSAPCMAQENVSGDKPERLPFVIKTMPLNLINLLQTSADVLADIPVAPRWGVELGVNVLFGSTTFASYRDESYKGVKLRPAVKFYTRKSEKGHDYISLAFKYNNIYDIHYVNVIRQGGQYNEFILQRKHIVTGGAAFRFGKQRYLDYRKRWLIERYIGLGFRQLHVATDGIPADVNIAVPEEPVLFSLERLPGTYTTLDFMVGICIGWVIPARH